MTTVFITTYALTTGVYLRTGKISEDGVYFTHEQPNGRCEFYSKPNWHETEEEAVAQIKNMQQRKIKSLKKRVDEIEQSDTLYPCAGGQRMKKKLLRKFNSMTESSQRATIHHMLVNHPTRNYRPSIEISIGMLYRVRELADLKDSVFLTLLKGGVKKQELLRFMNNI